MRLEDLRRCIRQNEGGRDIIRTLTEKLQRRCEALANENAQLREALAPFAAAGKRMPPWYPADRRVAVWPGLPSRAPKADDYFAAAKALKATSVTIDEEAAS
jgi:hypothetical protein